MDFVLGLLLGACFLLLALKLKKPARFTRPYYMVSSVSLKDGSLIKDLKIPLRKKMPSLDDEDDLEFQSTLRDYLMEAGIYSPVYNIGTVLIQWK